MPSPAGVIRQRRCVDGGRQDTDSASEENANGRLIVSYLETAGRPRSARLQSATPDWRWGKQSCPTNICTARVTVVVIYAEVFHSSETATVVVIFRKNATKSVVLRAVKTSGEHRNVLQLS